MTSPFPALAALQEITRKSLAAKAAGQPPMTLMTPEEIRLHAWVMRGLIAWVVMIIGSGLAGQGWILFGLVSPLAPFYIWLGYKKVQKYISAKKALGNQNA